MLKKTLIDPYWATVGSANAWYRAEVLTHFLDRTTQALEDSESSEHKEDEAGLAMFCFLIEQVKQSKEKCFSQSLMPQVLYGPDDIAHDFVAKFGDGLIIDGSSTESSLLAQWAEWESLSVLWNLARMGDHPVRETLGKTLSGIYGRLSQMRCYLEPVQKTIVDDYLEEQLILVN